MGRKEDQRLIRAAQCSLVKSMAKALAAGADPDAADEQIDGRSVLAMCCHSGWMPGAQILLDAGADIECSKGGYPALFCAAGSGHRELVEFLLTKGAQVDSASMDGSTALLAACGWPQGKSPDHFLMRDRCAQLLIAAGADIDWKSPANGCHAMLDAARWGRIGALSMLIDESQAKGSWERVDQAELVREAVSGSDPLDGVALLLARGAKLEGSCSLVRLVESGAFGTASMRGPTSGARRLELIRTLVAAGADMEEERVAYGGSALFRAVGILGPQSPEALLLVELGAAQDKVGPGGFTALERACSGSGSSIMGLWKSRALAGREFRELSALEMAKAGPRPSGRI